MDLGALRAVVLATNMAAHGVPVTVTLANADPIETTGIWMTPIPELAPTGSRFSTRAAARILVLRKADVPLVPTGTVVLAAENPGGTARHWRIDGIEREEPAHTRAFVLPAPDLD